MKRCYQIYGRAAGEIYRAYVDAADDVVYVENVFEYTGPSAAVKAIARLALLPRALRFAGQLVRAEDLAAHGRFTEAMRSLREMYAALGQPMPSDTLPVEANLICAVVAANLRNVDLSLQSRSSALKQLRSGKHSLRPLDVKYLENYCKYMLEFMDLTGHPDVQSEPDEPFHDVDLRKVRRDLLRKFPLPAAWPSL